MSTSQQSGYPDQTFKRNLFRVLGVVVLGTGLFLTFSGVSSLFANTAIVDPPAHFGRAFVGLPLIAVGAWLLQAGFMGSVARYAAGETVPVLKDGLHDLGLVKDEPVKAGPFCRACGVRNDAEAKFCDACGGSLV